MPSRMILGLAVLGVLTVFGCHTVWEHPDATAAKYDRDLYFCQYGVEPDPDLTEAELRERALLVVRRGWKQCMTNLGWQRTRGDVGSEPWARAD